MGLSQCRGWPPAGRVLRCDPSYACPSMAAPWNGTSTAAGLLMRHPPGFLWIACFTVSCSNQ